MEYYNYLLLLAFMALAFSSQELAKKAHVFGRNKRLYLAVGIVLYFIGFIIGFYTIDILHANQNGPSTSIYMKTFAGLIFGGLSVYSLSHILGNRWKKE